MGQLFKNWKEVKELAQEMKSDVEHSFYAGTIHRFHYHGFIVILDGGTRDEKKLDADLGPRTFKNLMSIVKETKERYPNSSFEISLEGHWDLFDSYQDKLTSGGDYYPADEYINVPLYKEEATVLTA